MDREPDDLPRHVTSDPKLGFRRPGVRDGGKALVWLILGVVAVLAFLGALWLMAPAR